MKNSFGENLKNLRVMNNIPQTTLAEKLNVSFKTISHWENGYSEPSIEQLIILKDFFEVSYEDLIE